jgi:hypothetical protein
MSNVMDTRILQLSHQQPLPFRSRVVDELVATINRWPAPVIPEAEARASRVRSVGMIATQTLSASSSTPPVSTKSGDEACAWWSSASMAVER